MVMPVTYVELNNNKKKKSKSLVFLYYIHTQLHPYTLLESYRKYELNPTKQVDEHRYPSCLLALYQKLVCSHI